MSIPAAVLATGSTRRFDDASAERVMTRLKSLTLPYRQRSGKRVTCVIDDLVMTRTPLDVLARARVRARKAMSRNTRHMRHQATPIGGRR
jgi:hypothetical protein